MTTKRFCTALVYIFAIFGLASTARIVFLASPELLASQVFLMAPLVISAYLLCRLVRRSRSAV